MKSRPILFSAPMVRAILDGRKTQTRRIAFPKSTTPGRGEFIGWVDLGRHGRVATFRDSIPDDPCPIEVCCPFGAPGDRLWVRETWKTHETKEGWDGVRYEASPDAFQRIENTREASEAWSAQDRAKSAGRNRWRPSIHMPRWASRLTLEVTDVRVERLIEISEADAVAEGVARERGRDVPAAMGGGIETWHDYLRPESWTTSARTSFCSLWRSVYGAGSWAANPWVWVVEFRRVET